MTMKVVVSSSGMIWVSYFLVGTALFSYATSSASLSISDVDLSARGGGLMMMTTTNRKLKEHSYSPWDDKKIDASRLSLDDYHPIDPVPSSKASIKPGPIEHGTPLNPYIPRLPPPSPAPSKPAPPKKIG